MPDRSGTTSSWPPGVQNVLCFSYIFRGALDAEEMLRFGLKPKVALLSHSNFGSSNSPTAS